MVSGDPFLTMVPHAMYTIIASILKFVTTIPYAMIKL